MLRRSYAWIFLLFAATVFVISGISNSWLGPEYSQQRTCSQTWGFNCGIDDQGATYKNDTFNDPSQVCDGKSTTTLFYVKEVVLTQSYALFGQNINATCTFHESTIGGANTYYEYLLYYNGTNWTYIGNNWTIPTTSGAGGPINRSAVFKVNSSVEEQRVRCIISYNSQVSGYCAVVSNHDNDDANFTAVAPLGYFDWGLTDSNGQDASSKNLTRDKNVTAHARWSKNLSSSYIKFDTWYPGPQNRSLQNISGWTNYTFNLGNIPEFPRAGEIYAIQINASDAYEQGNETLPQKSFNLWSTANISEMYLSKPIIYNGTNTTFKCKVIDNYSGYTLSEYNVSFFNGSTYIGTNQTNGSWSNGISGGWANMTYVDTALTPRTETLKCNITNNLPMYYNASSELSTTLQIVDLGVSVAQVSNSLFGSSVTIRANVTGNATKILGVMAEIYNSSDPGTPENMSMLAVETYGPTNTEYEVNYTPTTAGTHNVTIKAWAEWPEESGLYGKNASDQTSFSVGGFANITNILLSDSVIYNGTNTTLFCRIANNLTNSAIDKYNVSFYNADAFLGMRQTNFSGWANMTYIDSTLNPPQNITLKCNITGMPELSYNASSPSEKNITLQAVDLRVSIAPISDANFGSNITIRANVTGNASVLPNPVALITFYNYSLNDYDDDSAAMIPNATYSSTSTEYYATYIVKRSGSYNVSVLVTNLPERQTENSTQFDVSHGTPSASFVFPNFRVLVNQTFNLTVNLSSSTGDIVNPMLVLNFTNETLMNVSAEESFAKSLAINLTNGTVRSFAWNVTASELGLLSANVTITLVKGSNASQTAAYSVLSPIASVLSQSINITQDETLVVKVVGNTSGMQTINFTIMEPYGAGVGSVLGSYSGSDTENNCLGLGTGAGNVAVNVNTSCSGAPPNCGLAVDNSSDTSWSRSTSSWITINLSANYTIDTVELLWHGSSTNASMFYKVVHGISLGAVDGNANSGRWNPVLAFQSIQPPSEWNITNLKVEPFTTDTILLNTTGGINIYEIRLYPLEERIGSCYIYEANYTANTSGTNTFSSDVETAGNIGSIAVNSSFFVNFGVPVISHEFGYPTHPIGQNRSYEFSISAQGGDLRNMSAVLTILNQTMMNFTLDESVSKNVDFIPNTGSSAVVWNLSSGSFTGDANMSVFANSTAGLGGSGTHNASVRIILEDTSPPNISWYNVSVNATHLRENVSVTVSAFDSIYQVQNITVELIAPAYSINQTDSTHPKQNGLWEILIESEYINQSGNYSVNVYAADTEGNLASNSSGLNFTVYDMYSVLPDTNYSAYNRGENMTFRVYDVNNNTVSGVSWIVNESYIDGNVTTNATTIFEGTAAMFVYNFSTNKTSGIYYLDIYTNKSGNTGNYTNASVNASATLVLGFAQPLPGKEYNAGDSVTDPSRPRVMVRNVHNEFMFNITSNGGSIYLMCPGNSGPLSLMYEYSFFWGGDAYTTEDIPLYFCKVPSSPGSFYLTANATDQYNNSGIGYSGTLSVRAATGGSTPTSGGGGGGGVQRIIINETQNATAYVPKANFNFSLDSQDVQIMQGKEATVIASVSNTGDFGINITARNSETIPVISYAKEFFLAKSADVDIPIKIRANLTTKPGEYFVTIYLVGHSIEKNRAIKISVVENPDLSAINDIVAALDALKNRLKQYEALGIDVSSVHEKINATENYLASTEDAAAIGKMDYFSLAVRAAGEEMASAESELKSYDTKKFLAENNNKIAISVSLSITFLIVLFVFLAPYTDLSRKLYLLRRQERILVDARKSSENQYFMRKIDEATFHKIMIDEQDKLYKLRSEAKRLEDELGLLKRLKFSEIRKIKNEWKQKMAEAQKAKLIRAAHEGSAMSAMAAKKEAKVFRGLVQIITHPFRRRAQ